MKEKRFVKTYSQGSMEGVQIIVDTHTGVNYLFRFSGYAGGLSPLLDENGDCLRCWTKTAPLS